MMVAQIPTSEHALAKRFLEVFRTLRRLSTPEKPPEVMTHLSFNQMQALHFIFHEPNMTQKELAEKLEITPASISVAVNRLAEVGLVEKHPDAHDRRISRLCLGAKGQEISQKLDERQMLSIAELLSGVSAEEQETVVEILERALAIWKTNHDKT